jgi:hypothetical protein
MLIISFSSLFLRNNVVFSFPLLLLLIPASVLCENDDLVFSLTGNDLSCEIFEQKNQLKNWLGSVPFITASLFLL